MCRNGIACQLITYRIFQKEKKITVFACSIEKKEMKRKFPRSKQSTLCISARYVCFPSVRSLYQQTKK